MFVYHKMASHLSPLHAHNTMASGYTVKLTIIEVYTIQSLDAVYAIYMYTYIVEHREHAACVEGNP